MLCDLFVTSVLFTTVTTWSEFLTFLPFEFTCSKEWSSLFGFPSDDGVPLIKAEGKVAMASDPLRVEWVKNNFGSRANSNWSLKVFLASVKLLIAEKYSKSKGV